MTTDIRVLARKRFEQGKDSHSHVPKNRHERRAAKRHAELLEATRMRGAGQKNAPHVADSAKERHEDTLRAELAAQQNACPVRHNALIATLEVALALALASCGSAMTDDQDTDAEHDADVATDVDAVEDDSVVPEDAVEQPDEVRPDADADVEETTDVPDTPEVEEDGGVEDVPVEDVAPEVEDVPDVEDVPEVEGDTEEADATDAPDAEEESFEFVDSTPDCTETITIVSGTPVSGPELLCGSTQTATPTFEETSWVGADCEGTSTTRRMIRKDVVLTPPLDTAGLACARGTTTNALNGTELVVDLTPTTLDTAITLVCQSDMMLGWTLDGGVAEYDASFDDVITLSEIVLQVRPPSGTSRTLRAYDTGVAEVWTHDRGYVAFDIIEATRRASLCYVYVPIVTRIAGFGEVWAVDGGTFTFNSVFSGDGTQLLGWEWVRP